MTLRTAFNHASRPSLFQTLITVFFSILYKEVPNKNRNIAFYSVAHKGMADNKNNVYKRGTKYPAAYKSC